MCIYAYIDGEGRKGTREGSGIYHVRTGGWCLERESKPVESGEMGDRDEDKV